MAAPWLFELAGLRVGIASAQGRVCPVDGLDFAIARGETFALLGESGCGKSMTALALLRLLPPGGRIEAGEVRFAGEDLLARSERAMRALRGGGIGIIFQEPATSLNPVMTVGAQIGEALALQRGLHGTAARVAAQALLEAVGIADPASCLDEYPFRLSGGMKQRVMIAMALAGDPALLIADEPSTALDVTIQAQVLDLLAALQAERGMALLLITHDLGVVARMAHRVGVMYAGQLVETGPRAAFYARPLHPYARRLFAAQPDAQGRGRRLAALSGSVPALTRSFAGCRFAERCPERLPHCEQVLPPWVELGGQAVRCHLYAQVSHAPESAPDCAPELAPHFAFEAASASASPVAALEAATAPPEAIVAREAPSVQGSAGVAASPALLEVRDLCVHFPQRRGLLRREVSRVRAVDGLSLRILPGQTLALVGESGCGKSTVARALLRLIEPTVGEVSGEMRFGGEDLAALPPARMRAMRRRLQIVFQDPFASLNPRLRIGEILEEGMQALGVGSDARERRDRVAALLTRVGLDASVCARYPHEFSGGQRQRLAIARALLVDPQLILCDEPTSALDVSVQAQILNLLSDLQAERGLAYLFITHNIAVVDYLADQVAVMYLGRLVESGPAQAVLAAPAHPYTRALLAAVPRIEEGLRAAAEAESLAPAKRTRDTDAAPAKEAQGGGELPSALAPPKGCPFHPRCPDLQDRCRTEVPPERLLATGRSVRCHFPLPLVEAK